MSRPSLLWDIFCTVVDNYGDIGVCWRLACKLAQRGQRVRLWVDDVAPLQWLAPHGQPGVHVLQWHKPLRDADLPAEPADVLVEAFGCSLDDAVHIRWSEQQAKHLGVWINLEYLSAESYVERCHLLPSPVLTGAAAGLAKYFFYPGFTKKAGGLLREADLLQRQKAFNRTEWLTQWGIPANAHVVSLFCYEPAALPQLLAQLQQKAETMPTHLLVTPGRSLQAVLATLPSATKQALQATGTTGLGKLVLHGLPWLTQEDFDHLLWASDCNFVRGEDSLVRALWAGKPFVWHIYPQEDDAHHAKLEAFLDWLGAPPSLRLFHHVWNGVRQASLPVLNGGDWQRGVQQARLGLLQQPDLATQLLAFVAGQRAANNHQAGQ